MVGEVLVGLGASLATLKELDRDSATIRKSEHPYWRRFDPVARELMVSMQHKNDRGMQWGRIKWELYRIDSYWIRENPRFAFPGPWCTQENGHVANWCEAPEF